MKKTLKAIVTVLLLAVCIGSAGMFIKGNIDYAAGDSSYGAAKELAGTAEKNTEDEPLDAPKNVNDNKPTEPEVVIPDEPDVPLEENPEIPEALQEPVWHEAPVTDDPNVEELKNIDLEALREVNPDVIGWIYIPGTAVDYPIMQGEDNEYYLENTWEGKPSSVGSIFMECKNSQDFSDYNTILYGHHMKNGSMFATVKYYGDQNYWGEHPYIYVVDDSGVHRYEVFAAFEAGVTDYPYYLGFTEERRQEFIDFALDMTKIDAGVEPTVNDRMLTLSTCTGRGYATRLVVQARLPMVAE